MPLCCMSGKSRKRAKERAKITNTRLNRFLNRYSWASWDKESVKIVYVGRGDCPGWTIQGTYKKADLQWESSRQTGKVSHLLYTIDGKTNRISRATLSDSSFIETILIKKIKESKYGNRS